MAYTLHYDKNKNVIHATQVIIIFYNSSDICQIIGKNNWLLKILVLYRLSDQQSETADY